MTDISYIETVVNTYGRYVYNCALKLTCSPDTAEDLAQETFIQAWQKLDTLRDKTAIKTWLRSVLFNQFLMQRRRADTTRLTFTDDESLLEDAAHFDDMYQNPLPEVNVIVDEAVRDMQSGCFYAITRRLTLDQRMVFSLVDMLGMSVDEAATVTGVSKGAVKALLFRARMNIDNFFAKHCYFIHIDNPCSCTAWQKFWEQHGNNQSQVRAAMPEQKSLDYTETGYTFCPDVRAKLRNLYEHLAEHAPGEKWAEKVAQAVSFAIQTAST